jgi:hypothetical protein
MVAGPRPAWRSRTRIGFLVTYITISGCGPSQREMEAEAASQRAAIERHRTELITSIAAAATAAAQPAASLVDQQTSYRKLRDGLAAASTVGLEQKYSAFKSATDKIDAIETKIVELQRPLEPPALPEKPVLQKPEFIKDESLTGEDRSLVGRDTSAMFDELDREYREAHREEVAAARKEYQLKQREYAAAVRERKRFETNRSKLEKARAAQLRELIDLRSLLIGGLAKSVATGSPLPIALAADREPGPSEEQKTPGADRVAPEKNEPPARVPKGTRAECASRAESWHANCVASCDSSRIPGCGKGEPCHAECLSTCRTLQGVEERTCNGE